MESDDPESPAPASRPPRLANDPFRYIRRVKGGRYQVRPIDLGQRYNLGCFKTLDAAHRALDDFWWGRLPDKPKYVRPVHYPKSNRTLYFAMIPIPAASDPTGNGRAAGLVKLGPYRSPRVAAARARKYLTDAIAAGQIEGPLERWLTRSSK